MFQGGDDRGQIRLFMGLIGGAIALVVVTIVLLLGMTLVGGMAGSMSDQPNPVDRFAGPDPVVGDAVEFEDTAGEAKITQVYSVRDSRGYGVALTGAPDSYVESDDAVAIASDETWTVATWASVNASATGETMTAVSADGRVLIQYNGSTSKWTAWYFDDGTSNSYRVSVAAPNQPGNYSRVAARHNGTHFTIYRNTTQGETVATTTSNIAPVNVNSTNWQGRLDETRTFDDALNSSQRQALVTDPVGAAPDTNRTARLMFDQGGGASTPIYFAGTSATLSNHTWADGLAGNTLSEGTDYELDVGDGTITALSGGRVANAPVVFIDYEYVDRGAVGDLALVLGGGFELFSSAVLVVPAVAILAVLIGGLVVAVRSAGSGSGRDASEWRR